MGRRRLPIVAITALGVALLVAPPAEATFHLISIREVYPGSAAHPDSGYVELQMYFSGQNQVGGHALTVYNASGTAIGSFTFAEAVANAANQQTILIGDSGVQAAFGVKPDLTDASLEIRAAGGAACWAGSIDCVSWGSFSGSTPSASGAPADPLGIPDGMALRRTIAPNCQTLLEAADDSDDSAADFGDASPQPRNNASAISESPCMPPPDTTPPTVTIDSHPADPSPGGAATFKFHASEPSTFECSLAAGAAADSFSSCVSGKTYTSLADGEYTFKVRATDAATNRGEPAAFAWTVDNSLADTTPPDTTIVSKPPDPSESSTVSFGYKSNEPGSSFECELDDGGFAACSASGITYAGLANGSHAFLVRAVDPSHNVDPTPAGDTFVVAVPTVSQPNAAPPAVALLTPPPPLPASIAPAPRHKHRHRCHRRRGAHRGCHHHRAGRRER